jgi:sugar O-acyltransferase (sialic acid O-acetyltransferase NeuD family)
VVAALGARGHLSATAPLVLVGSGGFGREAAEAVRAINAAHAARTGEERWALRGFLDDDPGLLGTEVSGTRVLGAIDAIADQPDAQVVVCTGHPGNFTSKQRIVERLGLPPERYATLVHPAAVVPASCALGAGTVVLAGVVMTADVRVGRHVALMPQVVLTHDDDLGDYVTAGAGVRLAGGVRVEEGAYLGSGCLVRENRTVGPWALVGMGAVVTQDVPGGEVWAGVPARHVRAVA